MASGSLQVGNDYLVIFPQMRDAQSGDPVLDLSATFQVFANWTGQSGGLVASGPMVLDTNPASTPGTYVGVLVTNGFTPSMNPVAIEVVGSNYNVLRRTVVEVSW